MRVRWTWPASEDLTHICDYISRDNPAAALRVARTVYQGVESLQQFPQRGRNGRVTGTRELVFPGLPYVAVYEIQTDAVWVLRVIHGATRWPPVGEQPDPAAHL